MRSETEDISVEVASAALVPPGTVPEAIGFCEQWFIPFRIRTHTREALYTPSLAQRATR